MQRIYKMIKNINWQEYVYKRQYEKRIDDITKEQSKLVSSHLSYTNTSIDEKDSKK